jgi:hypothetical protein
MSRSTQKYAEPGEFLSLLFHCSSFPASDGKNAPAVQELTEKMPSFSPIEVLKITVGDRRKLNGKQVNTQPTPDCIKRKKAAYGKAAFPERSNVYHCFI